MNYAIGDNILFWERRFAEEIACASNPAYSARTFHAYFAHHYGILILDAYDPLVIR